MANNKTTTALCLTDKLNRSMKTLLDFPCSVVEAPMGYGKTTAVREALCDRNIKVLWLRVYEAGFFNFWKEFCNVLTELDKDLAASLLQIGLPTDPVLMREVIKLVNAVNISADIVLVIDDYHYAKADEAEAFLAFFLENMPVNMHMIVITCLPFLEGYTGSFGGRQIINYIGMQAFEFRPNDIAAYFSLCGINLLPKEAAKLYSYCEGRVAVLYLLMLKYLENDSMPTYVELHELVRHILYIPLSDELKVFLISICHFDTFTLEKAEYICGKKNTAALLGWLTRNNSFVTYDVITGEYNLHPIFCSCVKHEFAKLPIAIQNAQWYSTGKWYQQHAEFGMAMECFYNAEAFDELLDAFEADRGNSFTAGKKERLIAYMSACPENIFSSHHYSLLIYARRLFICNEMILLGHVCEKFKRNLAADMSLNQSERDNLNGEYELLISFITYNDINAMADHNKKACKLMKSNSCVFDSESNWTFGAPSVLYRFYRESGKLGIQLEKMKKAMPHYFKLTGGHGMGGEYIMEAEILYNRGEMNKADNAAHTGILLGRYALPSMAALCGAILQTKIAIYNGDYPLLMNIMDKTHKDISEQKCYKFLQTLNISDAYIYSLLKQPHLIPAWLADGNFNNLRFMLPTLSAVHIVYCRVLLDQGEYLKLISLSEMFLQTANIFKNLIGHIYLHIYLAVAYEKTGKTDTAFEHLNKAMSIAMPDNLYMPFVENADYIGGMLWSADMYARYDPMLRTCRLLYEKWDASVASIIAEFSSHNESASVQRNHDVPLFTGNLRSDVHVCEQMGENRKDEVKAG